MHVDSLRKILHSLGLFLYPQIAVPQLVQELRLEETQDSGWLVLEEFLE